jgi:hypothetical protein
MAIAMTGLRARAASNQDRFREYNEGLKPVNAAHSWSDPAMPDWSCECADEDCSEAVQLTLAEYEAVRADGARFFVAPNEEHFLPEVERLIARNERYWVVEKMGEAGEIAEALDPRDESP